VEQSDDERRAIAQREANGRAGAEGKPLPFPNVWDALDPTKVPPDATPAQILESVRRFAKRCRPRPRKRHVL
jgi:hypothetical protein